MRAELVRTEKRGRLTYQPALDGVRALAVTAVLLYHAGVAFLPGGFLGVDAFFVLSGFLITSLLLAEHAGTGRIKLTAFWARRARRLLPALLAVIATVVIAFRFVLPREEIRLLRDDALATLGYVANWRMLVRGGGDYFAQTAAPSPLQHAWSLGIEEQFYLLWPLIVVALLAWWPPVNRRIALLTVCVAGAVTSGLLAALYYDPISTGRAYYGTDSRAAALLIGASLAAMVKPREGRHRFLGTSALIGAIGVGWLWTHADGTASWLYHGGLVAGALAVAAIIAHASVSPASPTARLLALPPLVWLGRISYGVYLWHWPLFQLLNGSRTGLTGPALLGVRVAATLAVATVSYVAIEQPIRTGRWIPRRSGLVPVGAAATVLAIAATAVTVVEATRPPAVPPAAAANIALALPSATPTAASPLERPKRKPGTDPRVVIFGDSVAWSLGEYLPPVPGMAVTVRAIQGCGIARLPDLLQLGTGGTNYPGCTEWDKRWRYAVNDIDPDVSVILLDRWELMDRKINGQFRHVGEPEYDAYLLTELQLAVSIAGSRGARVVLLTAPYTRRNERPDGTLYDEDQPARVDAWNALLRDQVTLNPGQTRLLDLNAKVCPEGEFTWEIDGIRVRSDGLHFTPEGVRQLIAPWLMPQLYAIAEGYA